MKLESRTTVLLIGLGLLVPHYLLYGSPWTAWIAFIGYAPLMWWFVKVGKRPFRCGFSFGLFYAWFNVYWLGQFVGKWTGSIVVSSLVILFMGLAWGFFYSLALWITKIVQKRNEGYAVLTLALALSIIEFIRTNLPQLEFPFALMGTPLVAYPFIAKSFGSELSMTAITLLFNGLIALVALNAREVKASETETLSKLEPNFDKRAYVRSLFILIFCIPLVRSNRPDCIDSGTIKIALGQLGFDLAYTDPAQQENKLRAATENLIIQARAAKSELLIFPEAVAHFENQPATAFGLPPDFKLLFGASRGTSPRYQSAYLWDQTRFSHTDKKRLVVFGEYVPFRNIIPYPSGFKLPAGDLIAGSERKKLDLGNGRSVGPMICFESLFFESANDFKNQNAGFLAVMSLDDWYMGTSAIPRLILAARWRAVESGRWVARVGSLGKTAIIDPNGVIKAELEIGENKILPYEIPLRTNK
jgi:apolipoprotein N-acyltransferase